MMPRANTASRRFFDGILLFVAALTAPVAAFELMDLPRMTERMVFYERPPHGRLFTGDAHALEAMRRAPDIFLGFGLVQLNARGFPGFARQGPDTPEHIQQLWEQGFVGLKTLVKFSKHDVRVDDPAYDPLWARAATLRMPIVFHTEPEGTGSSHTRVADVARRFPGSPMILAHLADGQIDTTVRELKSTPNLATNRNKPGVRPPAGGPQ